MQHFAAPDKTCNIDSLAEMRRRCYQLAIVGLALVAIAIRHLQNDFDYCTTLCRIMIILLMKLNE
jgi:hypothetical protein